MALKEIISIPDPILREISTPVETITPALLGLVDDMLETMYEAPGIGLAGIQIGLPKRIVVIDIGDPEDDQKYEAALIKWREQCEAAEETGQVEPPRPERPERKKRPIFLINPEIISYGDEPSTYEEGCLSIPDYYAEVERPKNCVVEFINRDGKKQRLEADGLLSTCLQHEVDHLNGKLFIDHISKLKRDMVMRKFVKLAKQSDKAPASPLSI